MNTRVRLIAMRLARDPRPVVRGRRGLAFTPEFLAARNCFCQAGGDRLRIARVDADDTPPELAHRREVGADDGGPAGHCLQDRKPEPFV